MGRNFCSCPFCCTAAETWFVQGAEVGPTGPGDGPRAFEDARRRRAVDKRPPRRGATATPEGSLQILDVCEDPDVLTALSLAKTDQARVACARTQPLCHHSENVYCPCSCRTLVAPTSNIRCLAGQSGGLRKTCNF